MEKSNLNVIEKINCIFFFLGEEEISRVCWSCMGNVGQFTMVKWLAVGLPNLLPVIALLVSQCFHHIKSEFQTVFLKKQNCKTQEERQTSVVSS